MGGTRSLASAVTFTIPSGKTIKWLGLWNGATFLGYSPNAPAPFEFMADPATRLFTHIAHGFINSNKVVIYGDTPPSGITEGQTYFVVSATANTFKLAATPGGAAIAFTTQGGSALVASRITEEVYASGGDHIVATWIIGLPN